MPRTVDPAFIAALDAGYVEIVHLVALTFVTGPQYVWTGVGTLTWNGINFTGVGTLGKMGDVTEATDNRADGTTVGLSGLDPQSLAESLTEIQLGAAAQRWVCAVQPGTQTLVGTPFPLFSGQVDKPTNFTGPETQSIELALETMMVNHSRASNRRFTANDQHSNGYADDTGFNDVEVDNDIALVWG